MVIITDTQRAIMVTATDAAKEINMKDIELRFNFTNL